MADQNREEHLVSRSGRVLKKTLKMREMEDPEINEYMKGNFRKCAVQSSIHRKLKAAHKRTQHGTAESSSCDSLTSSSSDISSDDTSDSKSIRSQVPFRGPEKFDQLQIAKNAYSSDAYEEWNSDVSSDVEITKRRLTDENSRSKQSEWRVNPKRGGENYQDDLCVKRKKKINLLSVSMRSNARSKALKRASIRKKKSFSSHERTVKMIKKILSELSERRLKIPQASSKSEKEVCSENSRQFSDSNRSGSNDGTKSDRRVQKESLKLAERDGILGVAPIDVAAHLKLLGGNLLAIGMTVARLDHIGPGVFSSLLDVLLCAMGPMLCLTREITGLEQLPEDVFVKVLDHIAYILPGL